MTGAGLLLVFGGLHLFALAGCAALFVYALTGGDASPRPGDGDDQGPGGPGRKPSPPPCGPPLTDARPARVRLRQPGRLADLIDPPPRRGTPEPNPRAPLAPPRGPRHPNSGGAR